MKPWEVRERERIIEALRDAQGFQNVAAQSLGLTPRQINYKIQKYGIDWQAYRPNQTPPEQLFSVADLAEAMVNEAIRVNDLPKR